MTTRILNRTADLRWLDIIKNRVDGNYYLIGQPTGKKHEFLMHKLDPNNQRKILDNLGIYTPSSIDFELISRVSS